MESYENHNLIFDQVMKIFASGEKFSMRKLKYVLMNEYLNKLQNKGETKIKVKKLEEKLKPNMRKTEA